MWKLANVNRLNVYNKKAPMMGAFIRYGIDMLKKYLSVFSATEKK